MHLKFFIAFLTLCLFELPIVSATPQNYLYTSSGDLRKIEKLIKRDDIVGVQVIYNWNTLEPSKGKYDLSVIEKDLRYLKGLNKKLFIQIQDRFFEPEAKNIPKYLLLEKIYNGGLVAQVDNAGEDQPAGSGWVAQQWNKNLRGRFQELIGALAKRFDGRIYGIDLPETSIDIDLKQNNGNFNCDDYFEAEIENMKFARKAFTRSFVVQFVNFFPCEWENDHQYMSRLFSTALANHIGLGGPDIVPNQKSQIKNSYPFFNKYKGKLDLVSMAVQEPTLTYINPKTRNPFTKEEFVEYAENYLGVNIIFWSIETPWLRSSTN